MTSLAILREIVDCWYPKPVMSALSQRMFNLLGMPCAVATIRSRASFEKMERLLLLACASRCSTYAKLCLFVRGKIFARTAIRSRTWRNSWRSSSVSSSG